MKSSAAVFGLAPSGVVSFTCTVPAAWEGALAVILMAEFTV